MAFRLAICAVLAFVACAVPRISNSATPPLFVCPPTKFSDSHPPDQAARLDSILKARFVGREGSKGRLEWQVNRPQRLLDSLLPSVRFLTVREWDWAEHPSFGYRHALALLGDTLYHFEELNALLLSAGFEFDSSGTKAAALVASLWFLMDRRDVVPGWRSIEGDFRRVDEPLDVDPEPGNPSFISVERSKPYALPMVEVHEVEYGTRPNSLRPDAPLRGVWVRATVNCSPLDIRVGFRNLQGGLLQPSDVDVVERGHQSIDIVLPPTP